MHRMGAKVHGLGANEPTCTPPGDTTGASGSYSNRMILSSPCIVIVDKNCQILRSRHNSYGGPAWGWNRGESYRSNGLRLTVKGPYHAEDKCVFRCCHTENWLRAFLICKTFEGWTGRAGYDTGSCFSCISTMLSDFSSSMLVEFPRIRLCQKVLIKLMRCMDQQYNWGGWRL